MCGIFSLLNSDEYLTTNTFVKDQFLKGQGRGPESSKLEKIMSVYPPLRKASDLSLGLCVF